MPKRSRDYQNMVKDHAMVAAHALGFPWDAHAARYKIELRFFKGDARRSDFDNLAKSITDALIELLYPDDSCIVSALVTVEIDRGDPRAEVALEVLKR